MTEGASEPMGEMWKYNPDYHRMAEFLGLDAHDRQDYGIANKISLIRDWAGLKGKNDSTESALTSLQKLQREMGINLQGKELINNLYQHIRLDMDRLRIQEETRITKQAKQEGKIPSQQKELVMKKDKELKKEEGTPLKQLIASTLQSHVQSMVKGSLPKKGEVQRAIQDQVRSMVQSGASNQKMVQKIVQQTIKESLQ